MLVILAAAAAASAPVPDAPQPQQPQPQAVGAIEVTARRPVVGDLQQGVQAYRSEFFTAVRPGTAFDMVQWLPGFTLEETRDVRGLGGAVGNVLIDGQPPNNKNETLATVLRRIPAAQVERVDIIVGAAPGIDMRGRSVIANVVLKKGQAPKGTVTASTQFFEDGRAAPELQVSTARKIGDRTVEASATAAWRVLQDQVFGSGPLARLYPDQTVAFVAQSRLAGRQAFASGSGAYQFPWSGGKLRVNVSGLYSDVDVAENARVVGAPALYTIGLQDTYRQAEVGLRYERAFGRLNWESQALQRLNAHSRDADTFRPPAVSAIAGDDTLSETVARTTLRFARGPKLTLEASAEGAYNRQTTATLFRSNDVVTAIPASNLTVSERRGEFGALLTWKPDPRFSLTAAARLETSDLTAAGDFAVERALTYLKPRLVLSWAPDKRTQVRLRGEHEVSQIGFGSFTAQLDPSTGQVRAGNPNIRPRRAWVAEAVVERQFWTGSSLVATLRRSALRDVVDLKALEAFGGATALGNIGDGTQTEFLVAMTLPLKRLGLSGVNLRGGAGWRWSDVVDPTTGRPRRLTGQSANVADLHFSHDLPRWKLTWGADALYQGPLSTYRPMAAERLSAVVRLSLFVEYRIRPDLNLRVEGFNLNDPRPTWTVESYGGLRGSAPLLYSETRKPGDGPYLFVRLRQTVR